MKYVITKNEAHLAKNPHHIFNLNVIIVHLAGAKITLEVGGGNPIVFLLIPLISSAIYFYIYKHGQALKATQSWFVVAHWTLAWRRGRMMLIAYAVAIVVVLVSHLLGSMSGGMMMNDFSDDDSSSSIISTIGLFFGAVVIFFTLLLNFIMTGISVYDAGKGIIDESITKFLPRDESSNPEIRDDTSA